MKRELLRAPKQLYDGKDVPAVLLPGFGKDRIYQARASPTRWRNIACHCSVEELIEPLKTRDLRAACRPSISRFSCCCVVRVEIEHVVCWGYCSVQRNRLWRNSFKITDLLKFRPRDCCHCQFFDINQFPLCNNYAYSLHNYVLKFLPFNRRLTAGVSLLLSFPPCWFSPLSFVTETPAALAKRIMSLPLLLTVYTRNLEATDFKQHLPEGHCRQHNFKLHSGQMLPLT